MIKFEVIVAHPVFSMHVEINIYFKNLIISYIEI